jgi:catechol 2,3-dioxygenase-like lactoylglutathione lyase family enzyme
LKIDRIDHVVLTVRDIEATCEFYRRVLNMEVITFAGNRRALAFGVQTINLHQAGNEFEPKAQRPTPGSADICFITPLPLKEVISHLASCGVSLIKGPVQKTGARGPMVSLYFHDPDGNLIEVSNRCG